MLVRIGEFKKLSNIGSRPQSIRLSEIGLRKNYWLPTSGHNIEREITTFGKGQITGEGGVHAVQVVKAKVGQIVPFSGGGGGGRVS
jgi:hypothetical protein